MSVGGLAWVVCSAPGDLECLAPIQAAKKRGPVHHQQQSFQSSQLAYYKKRCGYWGKKYLFKEKSVDIHEKEKNTQMLMTEKICMDKKKGADNICRISLKEDRKGKKHGYWWRKTKTSRRYWWKEKYIKRKKGRSKYSWKIKRCRYWWKKIHEKKKADIDEILMYKLEVGAQQAPRLLVNV